MEIDIIQDPTFSFSHVILASVRKDNFFLVFKCELMVENNKSLVCSQKKKTVIKRRLDMTIQKEDEVHEIGIKSK